MTSKKTRHALVSSIISLVLCCSMLIGTTFAWFTDEVTSAGNIIKSGTLDVQLFHGDSAGAITNEITNENAAQSAIFDYKYWEPGYTQTKFVTIKNNGDLAFKFQLNIIPDVVATEGDIDLAKVIDVYMLPADDAAVTREAIAAATPVGTLDDLMADADGAAHGILLPKEGVGSTDTYAQVQGPRGEISYAIALKMQESAGNEYQNKTVGGNGFKVQLIATQYTWENDSFDHMYDENADFLPKAEVKQTGAKLIETSTHDWIVANTTFQFLPNESYEEAQKSFYRYYHADFVVYADKDIPSNAVILPGYYKAYADFTGDQRWIGLSSEDVIPAGTEIRLVDVMGGGDGSGNGSISVNYEEICKWGNDGTGFLCGVSDQSKGALAGTTLTVELRLYETTGDPNTTSGSKNEETGEYITIGTYKYTFGDSVVVGNANQLQAALDKAAPGTTIQLMEGVDYGTVAIRPVEGNANTTTGCDYLVYNNEMLRKVEDLTIVGAPGATIEAIEAVSGYIEGSTGYLVDIQNLVIDSVEFKDTHTNAPHSYAAPVFFDLSYINVDGLTVKNCKLIGDNDMMNFVYLYSSGVVATSYFDAVAKNVTITDNTVDGIARLCELRGTQNVTITGNTVKNTELHGVLLSGSGYSGNIVISNNTFDGVGANGNVNVVRMAGADNANVTITNNIATNYLGGRADFAKVDGGTPVIENNTFA